MRLALRTTEVMLAPLRLLRSIMKLNKDTFYNSELVVLNNFCCREHSTRTRIYIEKLSFTSTRNEAKLYFHNSSYSFKITNKLSLSQSRINKALIIISNISILNPSPTNTASVFYQNIQGLIRFSNLSDNCPNLDVTKMAELQCTVISTANV